MARLAVAAVLLVALCRVINGEVDQVAASPYYPFEPPEEEAVLPDGAYVEYNGAAGTSIAFVPPYLDGADRDQAAAAEATSPEGAVSPVDDADQQGFLRFPCRYHCRYRHMQWARHHGGLYRRHGEGFHGKEGKQLVAEMPVEPATHSEELREEAVVVPVAEPDPDSRQDDAAFAADEPVRGEEEDEDEMARFHHGRRSHHHHRHHRHQDEHEEDDHEQADEASPVERFRFHHHRRHHHHHHEEDEHEQRDEGAPMKRFRHHHHHDEMRTSKRFHHHDRDKDVDRDDEDELEEMAKRWIRKALMRSSKILHHHGHRFRHRAAGAAAGEEEEEKGGVMSWLKDFVNRF